jgi:hypothetical protein
MDDALLSFNPNPKADFWPDSTNSPFNHNATLRLSAGRDHTRNIISDSRMRVEPAGKNVERMLRCIARVKSPRCKQPVRCALRQDVEQSL